MTSIYLPVIGDRLTTSDHAERRGKARIDLPFAVIVRGSDAKGIPFEVETVLENLSAGGLYMRLDRDVEPGAKLFCLICFSTSAQDRGATRIAARGVVLRAEPRPDGTSGVAVCFTYHRIFYPQSI